LKPGNQDGLSAFPLLLIHLQKKINVVKISHVIVAQYPAESAHFLQEETVDGKKMIILHR
jgi:hypothetical protein